MSAPKSDPVEGLIDHLMGFAREKCVACIANDARMAIDVEHTCELRREAAANSVKDSEGEGVDNAKR